jgi:hypothetical protein
MKLAKAAALGVLVSGYVSAANALIVVDGVFDADYGLAKSVVTYDPRAPLGNFDTPGTTNHAAGYSIYLKEQGGAVYGFMQATPAPASPTPFPLAFANLYFDLDRANGNGSDLGFEVTNKLAFVPGQPGSVSSLGLSFMASADGTALEFSIPDALFTGPIAGLNYNPGQVFTAPGGDLVLRLSQSFGYSVAGGESYGADRLGVVTLQASPVPGPIAGASLPGLAMALGGFFAWRRRRSQNPGRS